MSERERHPFPLSVGLLPREIDTGNFCSPFFPLSLSSSFVFVETPLFSWAHDSTHVAEDVNEHVSFFSSKGGERPSLIGGTEARDENCHLRARRDVHCDRLFMTSDCFAFQLLASTVVKRDFTNDDCHEDVMVERTHLVQFCWTKDTRLYEVTRRWEFE